MWDSMSNSSGEYQKDFNKMIIEFSDIERQIIERAKNQGWHVSIVYLSPGVKGFQLRDSEGNGYAYAASEPECWKFGVLNGVLS